MRFLVDAQLPRRLASLLRTQGHDTIHTLDLPNGNRTTDHEINAISVREDRVVITKDADFVNSLLVLNVRHKLLPVSTGNITNVQLEALSRSFLPLICEELEAHRFLELSQIGLLVHN